jgi:hypothetical protein
MVCCLTAFYFLGDGDNVGFNICFICYFSIYVRGNLYGCFVGIVIDVGRECSFIVRYAIFYSRIVLDYIRYSHIFFRDISI